jgi:hypothetical protein
MEKKLLSFSDQKLTFIRMVIIAIPSYSIAFITEKVFYVVPTIAMMMIIANSVERGNLTNRNRIDEDSAAIEESFGRDDIDGGV